jgi:hypothetical protein
MVFVRKLCSFIMSPYINGGHFGEKLIFFAIIVPDGIFLLDSLFTTVAGDVCSAVQI